MFAFLERCRDVAIPHRGLGQIELTCRLNAGIAKAEIPLDTPEQLRELWLRTSGGSLLVDQALGICGLTLHGPVEAKWRCRERAESGYEVSESDWLIGEFVGDTDMLVIDVDGAVLISTGSYRRSDWYRFGSLSAVLHRYVEENAEKYWEFDA